MGFVDDHKIPECRRNIGCFSSGELIRADDDMVFDLEWTEISLFDCLVVRLRLQYLAGQEEFLCQFLMPLFPKIRWSDDQEPPLTLCPLLR